MVIFICSNEPTYLIVLNIIMKEPLQIIIFSYNRAMQCSALLDSIKKYWKTEAQISILYNTSDETLNKGYEHMKDKFEDVHFLREHSNSRPAYSCGELSDLYNLKLLLLCPHLRGHKTDFRQLLINHLSQDKNGYTVFLTDDSVFIRPVSFGNDDFKWLRENPRQRQLSLRHGLEMAGNRSITTGDNRIEWRFPEFGNGDHWGYRFSLDGHIYCNSILTEFLSHASFSNPNTLESSGMLHACHKGILTEGRSAKQVCLLSYPINIVQTTFANESMNADASVLNDYYLKGYSLCYPPPDSITSFQVYPSKLIIQKDSEQIEMPTRMSDR